MTASRDVVGATLALALAAWVGLSALTTPGSDAVPMLGTLAVAVLAYLAGRATPRTVVAPATLALALGVVAAVVLAGDGLSGGPTAGPLGYGNANGALCLLGVVAGAVLALDRRAGHLREAGPVLAVVCTGLAVLTASKASAALAVLVLLGGGAALLGWRRGWRVLAVALPLVALVATVALGAAYQPDAPRTSAVDRAVDAGLTERRVVLWSESLELVRAHPLTGTGPGGFATSAPTAVADADARWSHSLLLQQAAETGVVGALLLAALLGWVLLRVAASPSRRRHRRAASASGPCSPRPTSTTWRTSRTWWRPPRWSAGLVTARTVGRSRSAPGNPGLTPPAAVTPCGRSSRSTVSPRMRRSRASERRER